MQNNFRKFLSLGIILSVFLITASAFKVADSSAVDNLSGYGWGADDAGALGPMNPPGGMGWLSFNCISGGTCGSSDYGVNINSEGYLEGYAWSSNYGWLKFGELETSDMPSPGAGTTTSNARLVDGAFLGGDSYIVGFARFCAVYASGCNGSLANDSYRGGWDGWVSLSGHIPSTVTSYGVSLTGNSFSGYAWGGDVVGWIDFSNVEYNPISDPVVTLTATTGSNGVTTLNWTSINTVTSPTGCYASYGLNSPTTPGWTGWKPSPNGTFAATLSPGTYVFRIYCIGISGENSPNSSVTVNIGIPTLELYATPSPVYPPSFGTTVSWNGVNGNFVDCVAESASLNSTAITGWQGPVSSPPSSTPINAIYHPTHLRLTCLDTITDTPVIANLSIPQSALPESITLTNTAVVQGPPGVYTTTLSWTAVNIQPNSCHPTSANPTNVPSWMDPDPKTFNGSGNGSDAGVVVTAVPPAFTTYTITCQGISGDIHSASVNLNQGSGATINRSRPRYIEN